MDRCVMPLSGIKAGSRGSVVAFEGGMAFQTRLVDMGLDLGCEIEVLRGGENSAGPMLIAVGETRLALGRGMSERVLVALDPE